MKKFLILLILFSLGSFQTSAHVAKNAKRQRESHVHGLSKMSLVVEENQLLIKLNIPAQDLLGFEHSPATKKQKKSFKEILSNLAKPLHIFKTPDAADCKLKKKPEITTSLEQKHHHHDHEHKHDQAQHAEHADFKVQYLFNCKKISRLKTIDFILFKHAPLMKKVKTQVVTSSQQLSTELTPTSPTLFLDQ